MAYVPLVVTLISAHDLEDPYPGDGLSSSTSSSMEVYAVIYMLIDDDDIYAMQTTPADDVGGSDPSWGFTTHFIVPRDRRARQWLHFSLRCRSPRGGDYGVGDVRVSVEELLSSAAAAAPCGSKVFVSSWVTTPAGRQRGALSFAFRYGPRRASGGHRKDEAAALDYASEWSPVRFPHASAPPLALLEYEAPQPDRTLLRERNRGALVVWTAWLSMVLVCLLLLRHCVVTHPPPPPQMIIVYRCPALPPPAPPRAAEGSWSLWPAAALLGVVLIVTRHVFGPLCTDVLRKGT